MNSNITQRFSAASLTLIFTLIAFCGLAQNITSFPSIADASVYQGSNTNNYGATTFQIKGITNWTN